MSSFFTSVAASGIALTLFAIPIGLPRAYAQTPAQMEYERQAREARQAEERRQQEQQRLQQLQNGPRDGALRRIPVNDFCVGRSIEMNKPNCVPILRLVFSLD